MANIAVLQETNFQNAGAASSVALAYGSNVAAQNMLVVFAFVNSGVNFSSISDTLGTTWTALDEVVDPTAGGGRRGKGWVGQAPSGGANTVTVNFSGSTTSGSLVIAEISNGTVARVDGHIAQAQSTPVSASANAITTGSGAASTNAKQPALIYGVSINWGSGGGTPATGTSIAFVSGQTISWTNGLGRTESFRLTSTGAQAATWTAGATTATGMSLMVILDEGTGYNLAAAQGGYSVTGAPGAIDSAVPAQSATYSFTGNLASLLHGFSSVDTGIFTFTGFPATLAKTFQYVLLNDAITLATQAGLNVLRPVSHAHSTSVPYGYVISQVPASGIPVNVGTMVILTSSDGPFPPPPPVPNVPNVVGMSLYDAQTAIMSNGCNVNPYFRFQTSSLVAQGFIISQSPSPSGSVPAGTVVTLTVSLGIAITYYGGGSVIVPVMH